MFGVVVCPRCHRAKGVDLKQKTTACPCGFEIRVLPSRARARVGTERELIEAVRRVQAELAGGLAEYERAAAPPGRKRIGQVHARVAAVAKKAGDRAHRVRAAAEGLTEELEVFSVEDLRTVLEALGIHDVDGSLEELLAANVVYEPKEGFYRAVRPAP